MSSLFPERFETDRLVLTPLRIGSVDPIDYYEICSHREDGIEAVTEYLNWSPHETPKETVEFLESTAERWEDGDGAEYLIRPKDGEPRGGEMAGATGLSVDWERRVATLGMWLRKPFWGRGYSGERAAALMGIAFDRLDLEVVAVTHVVGNEKSRRAIEKYVDAHGGRREGVIRNGLTDADGEPHDVVRYSVTADEYAAAAGE